MRVFLAGATGVIGQRLVPQLVARGHKVIASTRSAGKVELLRGLGADPVVVEAWTPPRSVKPSPVPSRTRSSIR